MIHIASQRRRTLHRERYGYGLCPGYSTINNNFSLEEHIQQIIAANVLLSALWRRTWFSWGIIGWGGRAVAFLHSRYGRFFLLSLIIPTHHCLWWSRSGTSRCNLGHLRPSYRPDLGLSRWWLSFLSDLLPCHLLFVAIAVVVTT